MDDRITKSFGDRNSHEARLDYQSPKSCYLILSGWLELYGRFGVWWFNLDGASWQQPNNSEYQTDYISKRKTFIIKAVRLLTMGKLVTLPPKGPSLKYLDFCHR